MKIERHRETRQEKYRSRLAEIERELSGIYADAWRRTGRYAAYAAAATLAAVMVYGVVISWDADTLLFFSMCLLPIFFIGFLLANYRKMPFYLVTKTDFIYGEIFNRVMTLQNERIELVYRVHRRRITAPSYFGCFFTFAAGLIFAVALLALVHRFLMG